MFTFFWRGPFSQWHICKFTVDGVEYNCAEKYMMAEKARLFQDDEVLHQILEASSPRRQKDLGRSVRNFDETKWNEVARDIVYRGNMAKFTQNPDLWKCLKETEGTELAEASPFDRVWGIGLSEDDPRALDKKTWLGKNWLGEVLTKVRDDILSGVTDEEEETHP